MGGGLLLGVERRAVVVFIGPSAARAQAGILVSRVEAQAYVEEDPPGRRIA